MVMKIYVISLSVSPGLALDLNPFDDIQNSYLTKTYEISKTKEDQMECASHGKGCQFPFKLNQVDGRIYEQCLPKQGKWWCPNEKGEKIDCPVWNDPYRCLTQNKKAETVDHNEQRPVFLIPGFTSTKLYVRALPENHPCAQHFPADSQVYPPVNGGGMTLEDVIKNILKEAKNLVKGEMDDKLKCFADLMLLEHKEGGKYDGAEEIHVYAKHDAPNGFLEGVPILMDDVRQHFTVMGYTEGENFRSMPYDWRHSPAGLEATGEYFPYLKTQIEEQVKKSGNKPAVLIGYSYGGPVASAFLKFIMKGEDGQAWLKTNIDSFVPMAAPLLGSVDPIGFIHQPWLTRDADGMKDPDSWRNSIISALRSWPGIHALLPTGGDTVWGEEKGKATIKYDTAWLNKNSKNGKSLTIKEYLNNAHNFLPGYNGETAYHDLSEEELQPPPVKVYCLFHSGNPTAKGFNFVAGSKDENDYYADRLSRTKDIEMDNLGDTTVHIRSSGYMCWLWKRKAERDVILRLYQKQTQGEWDDVLYDTTHLGSLYNKDLLADLLTITASTDRTSLKERLDTETRTFFQGLDARRSGRGLSGM